MSGTNLTSFVLDTNIALYHLGNRLSTPLPTGDRYLISIITEIELLSYPNLSPTETQQILQFLNRLLIVNLNTAIKNQAIAWRKQYKLKLPDAIIVATAQTSNAILLTSDKQLLSLPNLQTQSLPIKP